MPRGGSAHKRERTITREAIAALMPALSMPPSRAAGGQWRRGKPAHLGIGVALIPLDAVFENVPQAGKDRLVSAACRLADTDPIAFAGVAREAANEASGE